MQKDERRFRGQMLSSVHGFATRDYDFAYILQQWISEYLTENTFLERILERKVVKYDTWDGGINRSQMLDNGSNIIL